MKNIIAIITALLQTISMHAGIGVGYSGEAPLPVELTTFSVQIKSSSILLNWQTATEVNNYGFEILRSTQNDNHSELSDESEERSDEKFWEEIGFVNGHGNSNSPKYYSFTDNSAISGKYYYRLKQIDIDGNFEFSQTIELDLENLPTHFVLEQNYPNPFNPTTTISYSIPQIVGQANITSDFSTSNVTLKVYDVLGNEVSTLVDTRQESGNYQVNFNANNISNGVYFYRISAGTFTATKKMILLK